MEINEEAKSRMRSVKVKAEQNSEVLENIVGQLVSKYNRDLDDCVTTLKDKIKQPDKLSDHDLETALLQMSVFLYFTAGGLESLGIEGDSAKAIRMEAFNKAYQQVTGTINDKQAHAELSTFSEHLVEIAFSRAYKKLKLQIEMAVNLASAVKKILSKRMEDNSLTRTDPAKSSLGRIGRIE